MDPIKGVDGALRALISKPEQMTESDVVRSPGTGSSIRQGFFEVGNSGAAQELKKLEEGKPDYEDSIRKQIEDMNRDLQMRKISLSFSVDESSQSVVVKVVDSSSGKVIRQIPPDEFLALRKRFEELAGMLVDKHI